MPDALSRMCEDDDEMLACMSECNEWFYESKLYDEPQNLDEFLSAVHEVTDEWYERRIKQVIDMPKKFFNWKKKTKSFFIEFPTLSTRSLPKKVMSGNMMCPSTLGPKFSAKIMTVR